MAARAYSLALSASPKLLSDVYGDGAGVINALNDIAYRQILISALTADAVVGQANSGRSGAYPALVLADGPTAYWRFEEGQNSLTFADSAGARTLTPNGGNAGITYRVPGVLGDGSFGIAMDTTHFEFALASTIVTGTTVTLEGWFIPPADVSAFQGLYANSAGGDGLYYNGTQRKLDLNFAAGTSHFNTTALTVGQLYHFAVVISAGNVTFYINGVADGTTTAFPGYTINNILGRTGTGTAFGPALVDEWAVYPTALTAQQVANHYALRGAPLSLNVPVTGAPLVLGAYDSGPLRLSDFAAVGVGATLNILALPH